MSAWTLTSGLDIWPEPALINALDAQAQHDLTWAGADGVPAREPLSALVDAGVLVPLGDARLGVPWQLRAAIGAKLDELPPLASARLGCMPTSKLQALAHRLGVHGASRAELLTHIFQRLTQPRALAEVVQRLPGETVVELLLLLDLGGRPIDPAVVQHPTLTEHLVRLAALGLVLKERDAFFIPMDVGLALGQWRAAYVAGRLSNSIEGWPSWQPDRVDAPLDAEATVPLLREILSGSAPTHRALKALLEISDIVDALLVTTAIERGVRSRPLAARLFASILGQQGSRAADRAALIPATAALVARWLAHVLQVSLQALAGLAPARQFERAHFSAVIADAARWVSAVRWFERVEYGVRFAATPPIASCAMLLADATQARGAPVADAILQAMHARGLVQLDEASFIVRADLAGAFARLEQERTD